MQPNNYDAGQSFELPQPVIEQANTVEAGASAPLTAERQSVAVELPTTHAPASAMPQIPVAPLAPATQAPASAMPQVPSAQPAAQNLAAGDIDLIEKEWVERAKAIVEQTKNDPFVQNKELSKIKAEYIKKRYNKDIKLIED